MLNYDVLIHYVTSADTVFYWTKIFLDLIPHLGRYLPLHAFTWSVVPHLGRCRPQDAFTWTMSMSNIEYHPSPLAIGFLQPLLCTKTYIVITYVLPWSGCFHGHNVKQSTLCYQAGYLCLIPGNEAITLVCISLKVLAFLLWLFWVIFN